MVEMTGGGRGHHKGRKMTLTGDRNMLDIDCGGGYRTYYIY